MKSLRVPACVNEFAQRLEATPLDPMPECPVESRAGPKKYPVSGLIAGQISRAGASPASSMTCTTTC
eukprot:6452973-Pyramimonas_sp.AAC.1